MFVEFADGQELFVDRITTGRTSSHPHVGSGNTLQVPMSIVCMASGWDTAVKIWFKPQKGTFALFGIGWKTEDRDIYIYIYMMLRGYIQITALETHAP